MNSAWWTWANALTALRLLLALPCAYAVAHGEWVVAALLLGIGIASDLLDGPVARRLGQTSALGGLLDHGTDALFVALLLGALSLHGLVPALLGPLAFAAFMQYALDSESLRGQHLRTSRLGRMNGIAYFVVAAVPVFRNAPGWEVPPDGVISAAGWLLVASTVLSMADRLRAWLSRPRIS